jgi:hypothetical protein
MKQLFYFLLLVCSTFSFAQINSQNPDFFVQYNSEQLTKKVSVAEVLNHSIFKEYNKRNSEFSIQELEAVFNFNKNTTVHGKFIDSLSYYQITIPIKDAALLKEILLRKKQVTDSLSIAKKVEVQDFGSFSMVLSDSLAKKPTVAWNKEYMVIFELTDEFKYNDFAGTTMVDEGAAIVDEAAPPAASEMEATAPPEPNQNDQMVYEAPPESPVVEEVAAATTEETFVEYPPLEEDNEYLDAKNTFEKLQIKNQEAYVQSLFEKGFVAPHSDKIAATADISSWINCNSVFENASKLYSSIGMLTGMNTYFPHKNRFGDFIKGINLNAYFDADNARIEETIEYNDEMTKIMQKITDRKINKDIYSYFPAKKPMGYLSYHFSSEELLKSFPAIKTELFGYHEFGEDLSLATDLITTLIDEEATATLLDGDFSFFVNDVVQKEIKTKTYEYNDNFEQVEKEVLTTKSIPLFTMVFTSTHPTFGDKLIQLGVRKGFFEGEGNLYYVKESSEYGRIFVLKDKDVIVVGNVSDAFNGDAKGDFVKSIKKELKKNSLIGAVDLEKVAKAYPKSNETDTPNEYNFLELSRQFNSLQMQAPRKLKNNKFCFEMLLNSTKNDKNIILQFLDAMEKMK